MVVVSAIYRFQSALLDARLLIQVTQWLIKRSLWLEPALCLILMVMDWAISRQCSLTLLSICCVVSISKNEICFIKFSSFIVPTNSKPRNQGFPEIWHCSTDLEWSLSYCNAVFKRHDQCAHSCECDNEHLTNCLSFLRQYHKSSLLIFLHRWIRLVLAMMRVLTPYI